MVTGRFVKGSKKNVGPPLAGHILGIDHLLNVGEPERKYNKNVYLYI